MYNAYAPLRGTCYLHPPGFLYSHWNVFKFKMQSWQCRELSDANSVGWCHPELCAWEDTRKSAFLFWETVPSRAGFRHTDCGLSFSMGLRGGTEREIPNTILEESAEHLGLNYLYPTCLFPYPLCAVIHPGLGAGVSPQQMQ